MAQAKQETFFSKYAEHVIVFKHDSRMLVDGNKVFTTSGRSIQFHRGVFETNEPEIIAFLKEHPAYGIDFFGSEDARASSVIQPKINPVTGDTEAPEVPLPARTKKGQKATVATKPTTAADVDAEGGAAADSDEE